MISVIIPAKNAAKTLRECLLAALHQENFQYGQDYEVIVVDDGSTDNTAQIAEKLNVTIIRQSNAGAAAARNAGAKLARGTVLAFTDADCAPSSTWLKELIQAISKPGGGGSQGCLPHPPDRTGCAVRPT